MSVDSRTTLIHSFGYAFVGIWTLLRSQRNAQIHTAILALVLLAGWWFGISHGEWIAVVLAAGLVFAAEAFNTAIESVIDLVSPARHPLAKQAKDVAAGGVLLAAIAAAIVGALIFLPRLLRLL